MRKQLLVVVGTVVLCLVLFGFRFGMLDLVVASGVVLLPVLTEVVGVDMLPFASLGVLIVYDMMMGFKKVLVLVTGIPGVVVLFAFMEFARKTKIVRGLFLRGGYLDYGFLAGNLFGYVVVGLLYAVHAVVFGVPWLYLAAVYQMLFIPAAAFVRCLRRSGKEAYRNLLGVDFGLESVVEVEMKESLGKEYEATLMAFRGSCAGEFFALVLGVAILGVKGLLPWSVFWVALVLCAWYSVYKLACAMGYLNPEDFDGFEGIKAVALAVGILAPTLMFPWGLAVAVGLFGMVYLLGKGYAKMVLREVRAFRTLRSLGMRVDEYLKEGRDPSIRRLLAGFVSGVYEPKTRLLEALTREGGVAVGREVNNVLPVGISWAGLVKAVVCCGLAVAVVLMFGVPKTVAGSLFSLLALVALTVMKEERMLLPVACGYASLLLVSALTMILCSGS